MSLFGRLFGGKDKGESPAASGKSETYKDFRITPEPIREGSQYRVAARIEKEVDGTLLTHRLIRADMIADFDQAVEVSAGKARQMIDEQGNRLFGD